MPHTIISEVGKLARVVRCASDFIADLQLNMSLSTDLKRSVADSTISIETNNQGIVVVVLDFAPGSQRVGAGIDDLSALISRNAIEHKEHRAGGKFHTVWECRVKVANHVIPDETYMIRITHSALTTKPVVEEAIEDSVPGGEHV